MIIRTTIAILLIFLVAMTMACKKKEETAEKTLTVYELFNSKCTQCHSTDKPLQLHGTEESILDLINKMVKKGAKVTNAQAMKIAGFLSSPDRFLFEEKCTTCHEMQKVLSAHKKEALKKETLKRMKMKGAEISEEDESKILDFLHKIN